MRARVCSGSVEEHAPALQGSLVRLRAHEPTDIAALNDLINDPDVGQGLGMAMPQAIAGYQAFLDVAEKDPSRAIYVIERIEGSVPIGTCSFFTIRARPRTAVLGIWLGKPYWDAGLGTDAVRTICRFGFDHMNLQRIELTVFEPNARAKRAYEKVGFVLEGTGRRSEYMDGHHVDSYLMGLLSEELIR
jgi:RimJ/RimL family protein N-acetyltransferase